MGKRLFLVRHAHRDTQIGRDSDNGLSDKGFKQAKRVAKYFLKQEPDAEFHLYSSPKKRCVQTLEALSKKTDSKTTILEDLNEGSNLEHRVELFIRWWISEAPQVVVACSHGDWIPLCVYYLTGARIECSKGSIVEVGGSSAAPMLINLTQNP